jgi:hypothetical protein
VIRMWCRKSRSLSLTKMQPVASQSHEP